MPENSAENIDTLEQRLKQLIRIHVTTFSSNCQLPDIPKQQETLLELGFVLISFGVLRHHMPIPSKLQDVSHAFFNLDTPSVIFMKILFLVETSC